MGQGYMSRTWRAMTATRNWFGKLCLLGLVSLIPVFGAIVVQGYLYGWARDAAWGMDNPMPRRILGNEDGRLYRRGFFSLVIAVCMTIVVCFGVLVLIWAFQAASAGVSAVFLHLFSDFDSPATAALAFSSFMGSAGLLLAGVVVSFGVQFFIWVATMRMSIYGTLSSGFQISAIWAMIRACPAGLVKIFFGQMAAFCVLWTVMCIVGCAVAFVALFLFGATAAAYGMAGAYEIPGWFAALGLVSISLLALIVVYVTAVGSVAIQTFVCRSLGLWTQRFEVALWGAQDDELPFEARGRKTL